MLASRFGFVRPPSTTQSPQPAKQARARARLAFVDSSPDSVVAIRQQLTEQGVFAVDGQGLILSQSYEFNSPSQAAVMLLARTANGLIEWKDASGLTLREHRQRQVNCDGDRS